MGRLHIDMQSILSTMIIQMMISLPTAFTCRRNKKTPQQLALEKFGTDWHDNEGVQPVDDEVLIDAIVETGTLMRQYQWNA